jgi:hypothetical protein
VRCRQAQAPTRVPVLAHPSTSASSMLCVVRMMARPGLDA